MNRDHMAKKCSLLIMAVALLFSSCDVPARITELNLAETAAKLTMDERSLYTSTVTTTPTATLTPTNTSTATIVPTPTYAPQGPDRYGENINPLTGLPVDDISLLERRPVLVKVSNYPRTGRPHAGLSFADIVWEYYIGEGANRFLALFYGNNSELIGPMRSGRLVDPQITLMYQGILVYKSADVRVDDQIGYLLGNRGISGHEQLCPVVCDQDNQASVISYFANSQATTDYALNLGIDSGVRNNLAGMKFDYLIPSNGETAHLVQTIYNYYNIGEWSYDPLLAKYKRGIEDVDASNDVTIIPLMDRITGEQLTFSNVVILFADHIQYASTLYDMSIYNNALGGQAIIFRDGMGYNVTWKAVSTTSPIQFFDLTGASFPLRPGNTWMTIMSLNSTPTHTDGTWTIQYIDEY